MDTNPQTNFKDMSLDEFLRLNFNALYDGFNQYFSETHKEVEGKNFQDFMNNVPDVIDDFLDRILFDKVKDNRTYPDVPIMTVPNVLENFPELDRAVKSYIAGAYPEEQDNPHIKQGIAFDFMAKQVASQIMSASDVDWTLSEYNFDNITKEELSIEPLKEIIEQLIREDMQRDRDNRE